MSSINSTRNLQILYFSRKKKRNIKIKKWQKKCPETPIYRYYCNKLSLL